MKLFGYFLIFTICFVIGTLSFAISDYPNQRRIIECSGDQGMREEFYEDEGWVSAEGQAGGLSNPKVLESLKNSKGINYSTPYLDEQVLLRK